MKFPLTTYPPAPNPSQEDRRQCLGSSDAPIVMNASPWMNRRQLFELKIGLTLPEPANFQMRAGIRMEPKARIEYEARTGILMPAARQTLERIPYIRANFDGINQQEKLVLEIKYAGRDDHYRARHGKIPAKYYWQLVHLLLVSGYEDLHYYSYNPAYGEGVCVPFKRDKEAEAKLIQELEVFWECITNKTPPSMLLFMNSGRRKSNKKSLDCVKSSVFKVKRSRRK